MNVSPISTALTPAASRRSTSCAGADAALRDQTAIRRQRAGQIDCVIEARDERAQVAIVDADDLRPRIEHARQVLAVVQLDQRLHAQLVDLSQQRRQLLPVQNLRDQEHRIRPGHTRLDDLIPIDDEVLAQQRRRDRLTNRRQIRQMPLKERLVGQDADGVGAVGFVDARAGDRIEVGTQNARGRRRLLHLGDDAEPRPAFQGRAELAHRRLRFEARRLPTRSAAVRSARRSITWRVEATMRSRMLLMGEFQRATGFIPVVQRHALGHAPRG